MPSASALTRWLCSNLHPLSQPSRLIRLPSSQSSLPARTASPQTMFRHVDEQVAVLGGSHCSPFAVLTKPSPHVDVTQSCMRQILPVPHVVPAGGAAVVVQRWPGRMLTVTIVHVSVPLQRFPSVHES